MKNHRVALSSFRPLLSNDFSERTTIMLSNNAVVVYFSRTGENYSVGEIEVGNTAKVAQVIASRIGAPTVEIVPVEPYPNVYDEAVAQATQERSAGARPAFTLVAGDGADNPAAMLDSAETIYLATQFGGRICRCPFTHSWKAAIGAVKPLLHSARMRQWSGRYRGVDSSGCSRRNCSRWHGIARCRRAERC